MSSLCRRDVTVRRAIIFACMTVGPISLGIESVAADEADLPPDSIKTIQLETGSVGVNGSPASISSDGRHIAYGSSSENLVPGDTNNYGDIFVYSRDDKSTRRVSLSSEGVEANWHSVEASISPDGNFVAFVSYANNLVPEAEVPETTAAIYLHDLRSGSTRLVTQAAAPHGQEAISHVAVGNEGRYISYSHNFQSGPSHVYEIETVTGRIDQIDVSSSGVSANGHSGCVDMSPNGRYVAFLSEGENLSEGDSNRVNGYRGVDMFVRDIVEGTTDRVSYMPDGTQPMNISVCPFMSDDGRIVAYSAPPSGGGQNKATVFDRLTRRAEFIGINAQGTLNDGAETSFALSGSGRFITFGASYGTVQLTDNPNGCDPRRGQCQQTYLKDLWTGKLSLITADPDGRSMQMTTFYTALDYSGRYVAYVGRPGPSDWYTHLYLADRGPVANPLDTEAPSVVGSTTSEPNDAGWHTSPVTVFWTATDAFPSSGMGRQPAETELSTDGANQYATSSEACDNAANCATGRFGPVSIDQTAPNVSVHGVANGAEYAIGSVPAPVCEASDSLSGLQEPCSIDVFGGNANGVGSYTATASARDVAGNVATISVQYRVVYGFSGFYQPIDPSGVSIFQAGGIIPLKFSLTTADGTPIAPLAAPRWIAPQRGGVTTEAVDEAVYDVPATTGNVYELRGDSWRFNWRTPRDAGGYYWRIGAALDDGTIRYLTVGLR